MGFWDFFTVLRFYTINVKNDEDEVDGDGPSWGLDASADDYVQGERWWLSNLISQLQDAL